MLPNIHDPEYWVEELRPLLDEVQFAFQLAVPRAHDFFVSYERAEINRPLLSNLIRYYALTYLQSKGYSAWDEASLSDKWAMRGLSNNGIEIVYRRCCLRIRKGIEPPCPATATSQDFYQQRFQYQEEPVPDGVINNLLVLWNLTSTLQYEGIKLARPTGGDIDYAQWDWLKSVPAMRAKINHPVPPEYARDTELPLDGRDETDSGTGTKTGTDD